MEVGELKKQKSKPPLSGERPGMFADDKAATSHGTSRKLVKGIPLAKASSQLHSRETSGTTTGKEAAPESSGRHLANGDTADSLLFTTHDNTKLMSMAAEPPSEHGGRSALNTQASYLCDDPLRSAYTEADAACIAEAAVRSQARPYYSPMNLMNSQPEVAASNSRNKWDGSPDMIRRRPMDDSALGADGLANTHTLEKLWPLMAAVQRRQNSSGASPQKPSMPAFRLTSGHSSSSRPPKLTKAQSDFLGPIQTRSGPLLTQKTSVSRNSGFFGRHTSSGGALKLNGQERLDSLRMLDPRKERRLDPQERVRQWLEQNEQFLLSCAAPDWEKRNELPSRAKTPPPEPVPKLPKAKQKKPFSRLLSCFVL